MCTKYDILLESVKHYSENRDSTLFSIMSEYSVSRAKAKHLMLILTFGGSFDTWLSENKINKNVIQIPIVMDYYDEVQLIMNCFAVKRFPGYTTAVKIAMEVKMKNGKDAYRSALGLYLQDIESQIIMCVYDYICAKDITVHSFIHDKLLIEPRDVDIDELISEVKSKTTFDVKITLMV